MKNLATCTLLALTAGAAYALAQDAPPTPEPIPVVRAAARWDYRVVGLTELHAGALDTARDILGSSEDPFHSVIVGIVDSVDV